MEVMLNFVSSRVRNRLFFRMVIDKTNASNEVLQTHLYAT